MDEIERLVNSAPRVTETSAEEVELTLEDGRLGRSKTYQEGDMKWAQRQIKRMGLLLAGCFRTKRVDRLGEDSSGMA